MADIVATGAGGNVLDMTFCQGIYDMVAVMDLPDASSAIGAKPRCWRVAHIPRSILR